MGGLLTLFGKLLIEYIKYHIVKNNKYDALDDALND
jgi:hypothetical protein